jgi:hypothetical protein
MGQLLKFIRPHKCFKLYAYLLRRGLSQNINELACRQINLQCAESWTKLWDSINRNIFLLKFAQTINYGPYTGGIL